MISRILSWRAQRSNPGFTFTLLDCFAVLAMTSCILIGLTSCSFHLRHPTQLAPPLQHIYLQTSDPYGQLTHNLQQALLASGVHTTSTLEEATTILEILREELGQELLSVGGTQLTRQYRLVLTVSFQITDPKGQILVTPTTLSENRTIPIQSNQILGGSNEANNLYAQMRQAIAYNIINRLASQEVTMLVNNKITRNTP